MWYLMPKAVFNDEATFYLPIWSLHKPRALVGLEKTLYVFMGFTDCHSRKYINNFSCWAIRAGAIHTDRHISACG
jgi:hypothetical protein